MPNRVLALRVLTTVAALGALVALVLRQSAVEAPTELSPPAPRAAGDAEDLPDIVAPATAPERTAVARAVSAPSGARPKDASVWGAPPESPEANREGRYTLRARALDAFHRPLAHRAFTLSISTARIDALGQVHEAKVLQGPIVQSDREGRVSFRWSAHRDAARVGLQLFDSELGAKGSTGLRALPVRGVVDLGDVRIARPHEIHPMPCITGRVLSSTGVPVPRVIGSVTEATDSDATDGALSWLPRDVGEVVIDADGRFRVHAPGSEPLDLAFESYGYDTCVVRGVAVPTYGLEVEMAKQIRLNGRLVVPANGPVPGEYSVSFPGGSSEVGASPHPSGSFSGRGSMHSRELVVKQPANGPTLLRRELQPTEKESGRLADIDVTGDVEVVAVQLRDELGEPIASAPLDVILDGGETFSGAHVSDAAGWLRCVVPRGVTRVGVGRSGGACTEFEVRAAPPSLTLR